MLAQPAMLLPCPALEQEPEHRPAPARAPRAEGYDGAPGPAERRLAAVFAIGLSATLLASLLALQGKAGVNGEGLEALTTFSVSSSAPAAASAPPSPPAAPDIQPKPPANQAPQLAPSQPPPRPMLRLPVPTLPLAPVPDMPGEASASTAVARIAVPGTSARGDAEAEAPARDAAPAPASGNTGQPQTDAYAQSVFHKIRREQRYEAILRRDSLTGTVVLAFTIDRRGHLRGQRVALASPHPIIDRIALRQLAEAAPFPRPPRGEERSFEIPLTYRQRD